MERGYIVAMLRVDGISYNFINWKKSKSKLARKMARKRPALVNVIENARQLVPGECVKLKSYNQVTVKIVDSEGRVSYTSIYLGENKIYIYSDKVRIN